MKIDIEKIKEELKNENNENLTISYSLSEIFFSVKDKQELKSKHSEIRKSIEEIGFKNTANKYSMSDSAKFGGDLGWLKANQLSPLIIENIKKLKKDEISKIINIPGGFLILKLKDKKTVKSNYVENDKKLREVVLLRKNKKINQFSLIHFNKIKINSDIINVQ